MKKLKFIGLGVLLLFARGCDFYSTSLWIFQENGLQDEMNPLSLFMNVGWSGLVAINVIIILAILYLHYHFTYKYKGITHRVDHINSPIELASYQYYGDKNSILKLLYKFPKNRSIALSHSGYLLIRLTILCSFIATIHNVNQYYDLGLYQILHQYSIRPLYLIYSSFILIFAWLNYRLWHTEYKQYCCNVTI